MQLAVQIMRSAVIGTGLGFTLLGIPAHASHYHRGPTSSHAQKGKHIAGSSHGRASRHTERSAAAHPRAIDDSRATQIQTALVKAGYLQTASGKWDTESADAMRKLQGDNGWQTKIIPDSRALIKLGLGPGSEAPSSVPASAPSSPASPMAVVPSTHTDTPGEQQ